MKHLLLLVFIALSLAGCDNGKKSGTGKDHPDSTSQQKNDTSTGKTVSTDGSNDELASMTPLKTADLEKLLPEEIMGAERKEISSSENMGTAMSIGTYPLENSGELRLTIMDCGGAGGAGVYELLYASKLGNDTEDAEEYTKTLNLDGRKTLEHGYKPGKEGSLTWFTGKRYLVSLEGNDLDVLRKAAGTIKIK